MFNMTKKFQKAPIQDFNNIDISMLRLGEVMDMCSHGLALRLLPRLFIRRTGNTVMLEKEAGL